MRHATDSAGVVVAAREPVLSVAEGWSPYGVEVSGAQPGLGYTGEWFDAAVGLQYLRARWYDAGVGRFTSRDPGEGDRRRSQTLNLYEYVENDPVNWTDPSGLYHALVVRGANAHNPEGLAVRSSPSLEARILDRVPDGTRVIVHPSFPFSGWDNDLRWYHLASIEGNFVGNAVGPWVASRYLVEESEPLPSLEPTPPALSDSEWVSPFGIGTRFLKGYRFAGSSHNGIDLVSANDPFVVAGQVECSASGCWYIGGCQRFENYQDDDGRKVTAVTDGRVDWIKPAGTDRNSSIINLRYNAKGRAYQIRYVHVRAKSGIGMGKQVKAGDTLGWYGPYGTFGNFLHLHLSLFNEDNTPSNPEPYLP